MKSGQVIRNDKSDQYAIEDVAEFYQAIDRRSLIHKISPTRPYVYTTMEVYDAVNGIRGAGGLGVLAADTRRIAEDLDIPFVTLTPFYREERHQKMVDLVPHDEYTVRTPEQEGFELIGQTPLHILNQPDATLDIYQKILGSTRFLCMTEEHFGPLYSGDPSGDHRLYQMTALGFGGYAALKMARFVNTPCIPTTPWYRRLSLSSVTTNSSALSFQMLSHQHSSIILVAYSAMAN